MPLKTANCQLQKHQCMADIQTDPPDPETIKWYHIRDLLLGWNEKKKDIRGAILLAQVEKIY